MTAHQPEPRIPLDPAQLADLQEAMRGREHTIIRGVLQQPDYPPLPACPECGAAAQRIDSMVEPPAFSQREDALLINFKPCGHRFRALTDELTTTPEAQQ